MLNLRDIDHVVLHVRDIEAMARFYRDVFGAHYVAHRPEFGMTHLKAHDVTVGEIRPQCGAEGAGAPKPRPANSAA